MKLQTSHNSFANNYYTYSIAATRGEEIIKWVPYYFAKKNYKILAPHSFEYVKNGIN